MKVLKKLFNIWMMFAHALGWVNTRIILSLVYFVIITPLSLAFKLLGNDPMNRRFEPVESYWLEREEKGFRQEDYGKQF